MTVIFDKILGRVREQNGLSTSPQSLTTAEQETVLANLNDTAPNTTTGKLGYKVLQGNQSFAAQVTAENTIYEIRDVFDLNSGSVTIPANCKLRFEGGRVINGTINGNKTIIGADPYQIFDINTTLAGTFLNDCIYTEWFGAKADGSTDNFAVFQYVFDTSIQIGIPIQLIEGTYVVDECPAALDGQTLRINFTQDGQSFVLLGCGMDKTTIQSADGWLDRLWSKHNSGSAGDNDIMRQKKLIYYYRNNNYVANVLNVSDITFDRNGRSNTAVPPSDYAWEGQAIISSAGATGYTGTVKNFIFKNLFIKDRTSVGIGFGNATCDTVMVDGIKSDRQIYISGKREEIYPLVNCKNTIIRNCDVQFIQIEPITGQNGQRNTVIENCSVDSIEWIDNNPNNILSIINCSMNNAYLYLWDTSANIQGCSFYFTNSSFGQSDSGNSLISGKNVNFNSCIFNFTPDETYNCKHLLISNTLSRKSLISFNNCSFLSENISRFNMIEGLYRSQTETNEANADAVFYDCYFAWKSDMTSFDGSGYLITCVRGLNATLNNCTINRLSNTYLIKIGELSSGFGSVKIHNLKIIGSYGFDNFIGFYNVVNSGSIVDVDGEYPFVQLFRSYNSNSTAEYGSSIESLILVTNNPSDILSIERKTYIRGTKIKVGNLLYKYINARIANPNLSINDFIVTPINESMTQSEIDAINTTYLPTNSPVKVFNSTLGKYVMWYGSAWVNLDGTSLSSQENA